jgi:hypothetical protein
MIAQILQDERIHLAALLDAIQRCVFFLDASCSKLTWPIVPDELAHRRKEVDLFESLSTINERFAKLQDTLGAAMRHALLLSGESGETFLNVLAFYEKIGVLASADEWQLCRAARNLAAHAYETDYKTIAEHFNTLHTLIPALYGIAARFLAYCRETLHIQPAQNDFTQEFTAITRDISSPNPNSNNP